MIPDGEGMIALRTSATNDVGEWGRVSTVAASVKMDTANSIVTFSNYRRVMDSSTYQRMDWLYVMSNGNPVTDN